MGPLVTENKYKNIVLHILAFSILGSKRFHNSKYNFQNLSKNPSSFEFFVIVS
jgi:hypothetical protein